MIFGYRVNFDGNGALSGNVSSITCLPDKVCVLPENQYSDDALMFLGWALNPMTGVLIRKGNYDR